MSAYNPQDQINELVAFDASKDDGPFFRLEVGGGSNTC